MTTIEPTGNELVIFNQAISPAALFVAGAIDPHIARIKKEIASELTDPSTAEGRKRIIALAMKVTKTKTAIDAARVSLVSEEKTRLRIIDAEGKRIKETLSALAEEVRQPVTDFENREKIRIAAHEDAIDAINALAIFFVEPTVDVLAARLAEAEALSVDHEEFSPMAEKSKAAVVDSLGKKLEAMRKAEAERVELERHRREAAEREQREREEQVAAAAKAEAEEAARVEAERVATAEKAERDRIQKESEANQKAAQEAVEKAEQERREAIKASKDAAAKAERDRIDAEASAKRRETEATERERERIAEVKQAEEAEARKREANTKHRASINNEALSALVGFGGLTEKTAKTVVEAIAKNQIPRVKISY